MLPFAFNPGARMDCVRSVSDGWNTSSSNNRQQASSKTSDDGIQIRLILVDDSDRDQRYSLDIGSSTTLKTLFNDYSKKRGVSLRSLQFSYHGKTLFLSSVGNKTSSELNIHDQDVINVKNNTIAPQELSNSGSNQIVAATTLKRARTNNRPKNSKVKRKTAYNNTGEEPVDTLGKCMARHSKMLTKLHEEVQHQLKEIRSRLNALDLECQPPKQNGQNKRKTKSKKYVDLQTLPNSGIGGKAGRPYFIVQVGEVENLHQTKKPYRSQHSATITMIDLHGHSKNKALDILNESLPEWVDTAMKGEYPWVMPVKIVCGCGNQTLSEVVRKWIKSTRNISNAPKNCIG